MQSRSCLIVFINHTGHIYTTGWVLKGTLLLQFVSAHKFLGILCSLALNMQQAKHLLMFLYLRWFAKRCKHLYNGHHQHMVIYLF